MSSLTELKCFIIESRIKAKMPKESCAQPEELKICELLLSADYISYNDGSFLVNLGRLEKHKYVNNPEIIFFLRKKKIFYPGFMLIVRFQLLVNENFRQRNENDPGRNLS